MESRTNRRVMIVDDDETVLILAESILADQGFEVQTCSDSIIALNQIAVAPPDIIVLDVLMPGLDGFEFCTRLRASEQGFDIPVMIATSLDDTASINRAYHAGATDFAIKPLNWAVEIHRLRFLLRASETSRQLKAEEAKTRRAKEDWERTFNSISDMITLLDPELNIIRANTATSRALGMPVDSIIGSKCHRLFQNTDTPCPSCPILKSIRTGEPGSDEITYNSPHAVHLVTGAPVRDDAGELKYLVHIARDLTGHKRLEAELRQAHKMEAVGTLAGGIAHDFNNLLTVVSFNVDELALENHTESTRECLQIISDAVQRGAELARQLITFSRSGVAQTAKQPASINSIIEQTCKLLRTALTKTAKLELRLNEIPYSINAAAPQIQQVLMNLAVNASHAMPKGGRFTVETSSALLDPDTLQPTAPTSQAIPYVCIAVSDTGKGMDDQTLQRMYEPFFTTKNVGEGSGLGLSVVYGIIKDHGGFIQCESQIGRGTTFRIYLPAVCKVEPSPGSDIGPNPEPGTPR